MKDVAQTRAQPAGRPGSALLILGAIFATAMFLRVPIGPRTAEPIAAAVEAQTLNAWAALPIASMDRPSLDAIPLAVLLPPTTFPEPIAVTRLASLNDVPQLEVDPRRPSATGPPPMAIPEAALSSTAHGHMIGLATPVAPVPYVESPSRPFGVVGGAVGTAFVKTGAAITLAFKKTGQGILAPFN
jgi:hypothetical protein